MNLDQYLGSLALIKKLLAVKLMTSKLNFALVFAHRDEHNYTLHSVYFLLEWHTEFDAKLFTIGRENCISLYEKCIKPQIN